MRRNSRISTALDALQLASLAAKIAASLAPRERPNKGAPIQDGDNIETADLLDRVRNAFDVVAGTDADRIEVHDFEATLLVLLDEGDEGGLAEEVANFRTSGGTPSQALSVEAFAGWYRRFRPWAEERVYLKRHEVGVDATRLQTNGGDKLLLAACKHCVHLEAIAIRSGAVHNSTLSTMAQLVGTRLAELDLTDSASFDDLGACITAGL